MKLHGSMLTVDQRLQLTLQAWVDVNSTVPAFFGYGLSSGSAQTRDSRARVEQRRRRCTGGCTLIGGISVEVRNTTLNKTRNNLGRYFEATNAQSLNKDISDSNRCNEYCGVCQLAPEDMEALHRKTSDCCDVRYICEGWV